MHPMVRMLVFVGISSWLVVSHAEIKLDGYFIAQDDCPAYQSKNKQTNPGNIHLIPNMAYGVLAKNKAEATHYRLMIPEASPPQRWVSIACGKLLIDCREHVGKAPQPSSPPAPVPQPTPQPGPVSPPQVRGPEYLLALSWQPAFCQTHQTKTECETQTAQRYDAQNLALHGLWPQPKSNIYCNVSNNQKRLDQRRMWDRLPALGLVDETYGDLIETMPGVASYLQRHEWIKHGTCYSPTPEEYFRESISLTDQINSSGVGALFAQSVGQRLTSSQIKERFDESFGDGAGDKVQVKCDDGMIVELWINLSGSIDSDTKISGLLQNAKPAAASCSVGVIDPVGF
jgi:ribonuclease T2